MGVAVESSGKGRRSLNSELNLVSFVDLLSVCICFLLMTAVWLQVGALQVKQSFGTEGEDKPGYDLNVAFVGPTEVTVEIRSKGHVVQKASIKGESKDAFTEALGKNLDETITKLKGSQEIQVSDLIVAAMITPAPSVNYGNLVAVMDSLRKRQIINIGVVPKAG